MRLFCRLWLPVLLVLAGFVLFGSNVCAQSALLFSLDTTPVHYTVGSLGKKGTDSVFGSIQNLSDDSIMCVTKSVNTYNWIADVSIAGRKLRPDDTVRIGTKQILP